MNRAVRSILALPGRRIGVSALYRTPAWPPGAGPDFVNAVVALESPIPPAAMLTRLHAIEASHGRVRRRRWAARTLDLDLLAAGRLVRPDAATVRDWIALPPQRQVRDAPDRLLLPHPRLQDRGFVLVPLCEIAPGWRHPVTGRTARSMCDDLPLVMRARIRRIRRVGGVVNSLPGA